MAQKYIFQLRNGVRYVDENGKTLLNADGTPVRDDWTTYTNQEDHLNPLDAELVVEFEYNPKTGKKTPRFKLGYDNNIFANLEYISPDSFVLPTPSSVTIYPDKWVQMTDENGNAIANRHYQYVTINNATITPNSKVDLQPKPEDLVVFHEKDLAFMAVNSGGQVRICVIGQVPTQEYTMQVTVTEVAENA